MDQENKTTPIIGIVMGSKSDWPVMQAAAAILDEFGVPYEAKVVSAHRTPDLLFSYAATARQRPLLFEKIRMVDIEMIIHIVIECLTHRL